MPADAPVESGPCAPAARGETGLAVTPVRLDGAAVAPVQLVLPGDRAVRHGSQLPVPDAALKRPVDKTTPQPP